MCVQVVPRGGETCVWFVRRKGGCGAHPSRPECSILRTPVSVMSMPAPEEEGSRDHEAAGGPPVISHDGTPARNKEGRSPQSP